MYLKHHNTPPDVLALLAGDEDWYVRWEVANNPNTSIELLTYLCNDENYHTAGIAKKNLKQRGHQ